MPRVTWDTEADWDRFYGSRYGGYGRTWATEQVPTHPAYGTLANYETRVTALINLGITTSDRVLIGGCGYGYTMEVAHSRGYPWWGGIESSPHINNNRGIEAVGSTLWVEDEFTNLPGLGSASRTLQRDLGVPGNQRSAQWDWIITEGMLESLDDAEMTAPLNQNGTFAVCEWALEGTDHSQIVHVVSEPPYTYEVGSPTFNEKTLTEWKAMAPAHTFMLSYEPYTVI